MTIGYGNTKVYNNASEITGPTGWYMIKAGGKPQPFYVNQDYDGGGWVLVMANRRYTAGMNNLKWNDAIFSVNYRNAGGNDASNKEGLGVSGPSLNSFNAWIGLNLWKDLSGRHSAGKITIVQYMSDVNGIELNNTGQQDQRIRFEGTGFNTNGAFQGKTFISQEANINGWGNSGFYSMMGNNLTTFDRDLDSNGGNCSTYYNNNPFFYTSCWTGNIFGGGGYIDGPYWTSSTSGYSMQYCGVYIK
jgi:hypothetical protein